MIERLMVNYLLANGFTRRGLVLELKTTTSRLHAFLYGDSDNLPDTVFKRIHKLFKDCAYETTLEQLQTNELEVKNYDNDDSLVDLKAPNRHRSGVNSQGFTKYLRNNF